MPTPLLHSTQKLHTASQIPGSPVHQITSTWLPIPKNLFPDCTRLKALHSFTAHASLSRSLQPGSLSPMNSTLTPVLVVAGVTVRQERLRLFKDLIRALPRPNRDTMTLVFAHLLRSVSGVGRIMPLSFQLKISGSGVAALQGSLKTEKYRFRKSLLTCGCCCVLKQLLLLLLQRDRACHWSLFLLLPKRYCYRRCGCSKRCCCCCCRVIHSVVADSAVVVVADSVVAAADSAVVVVADSVVAAADLLLLLQGDLLSCCCCCC